MNELMASDREIKTCREGSKPGGQNLSHFHCHWSCLRGPRPPAPASYEEMYQIYEELYEIYEELYRKYKELYQIYEELYEICAKVYRIQPTLWSTTLSSKVNLSHAINLRSACGVNLVT